MTSTTELKSRIPALDGLRGLSIWAVLLAHVSAHFPGTPLDAHFAHMVLAQLGYFGVTVFFVISGFLITFLLINERTRSAPISWRGFYRRRAIRILPAFLLYFGAVLTVGHPTLAQQAYSFTFTTSYFFQQAYPPLQQLWSLSVEEQFYLAWPLLMLLGARTAERACWAVLVISPLLRLLLKHVGYPEYGHFAPAILDSIAAGCLLAFHRIRLRDFAARYLASNWAFAALGAVTLLLAEMVYGYDLVLLWGLIPCLVVLVIAAAIERKDWILNNGPIAWSGLLSYSLYLWQQPFLTLDGPWHFMSVRLLLTFAAAYLSYRFVEQPVLKALSSSPRIRPAISVVTDALPES